MAKRSKTPQEFFADFMMGGVSCVFSIREWSNGSIW